MILSDTTLREQIAAGRFVIEPLDESLIQPSSIDVRISHLFRVFRNHTAGVTGATGATEPPEPPEAPEIPKHVVKQLMLPISRNRPNR